MNPKDEFIDFCSFEYEIIIMDARTGKDIAMSIPKATALAKAILSFVAEQKDNA